MKVPAFKTGPVYQPRPWGGRAMAERLGKNIPDGLVGESWEVSAHPNGVSRVSGGPLDGTPLDELVRKAGADLVGARTYQKYRDNFPLLVKLIDVNAIASVQVHPNDEQALRLEGYPWGKTEAWYIIERAPDAKFYVGLVPGATPESFRESLESGTTRSLLSSPSVKPGDCILVGPGTVHAVGDGVLMLEIQQSSDITYRVYDWDRRDEHGKPRALHIDKALRVIDFSARPRIFRSDERSDALGRILASSTFEIFQARVATGLDLPARSSFITGTVVEGDLRLVAADVRLELRCGESFVLPAGTRARLEGVSAPRRRNSSWATAIVTHIL